MHIAEPLVPHSSSFNFEIAVEKLKRNESAGIDQIPAELIQEGENTLHSEIHELIHCIWNMEEFPLQWNVCITLRIYKKGKNLL
jgi:hypothetical protein